MLIARLLAASPLALALLSGAALAQEPPRPPIHIDPANVPGDFVDLPQAGQLKVPLGPKPGHNTRTLPPLPKTPSPGATLALEAANAALNSCTADGFRIAVAVTDSQGNLKAALASDGGGANRVFMALRKDVTVAEFKIPTLELRTKIAADPSLMSRVTPNMSLLPGGLPILDRKGTLVGAIATSGAAAYEEEKCARDGIAAIAAQVE